MVANVFVTIIPYQKKTVDAMLAGKEFRSHAWAKLGKQRSVHNNYLTLPVVFLMLSNHYPLMYATRYNWCDCGNRTADRPGDPPFLQFAPRGKGPRGGPGCSGGRHGGDRVAFV